MVQSCEKQIKCMKIVKFNDIYNRLQRYHFIQYPKSCLSSFLNFSSLILYFLNIRLFIFIANCVPNSKKGNINIAFQLMTHIQKALQAVDDRGKYQFLLVAILVFIYLELGLILLGSTFVYMNPLWNCPGINDPSEDSACPIREQCSIVNDFTATHYAELYCQGQNQRSIIQSAPYIGAIIGLLFLTPLADSKGKKLIFVLSQGLMITGIALNIAGVFGKAAAVIIIGQIILGAGCYSVLIIGYVIVSELTEDKFKQYSIVILNAVWALTQVCIAGFYFWFNYWSNYLIFILLVPNIILILLVAFYLVESPYFLIEKKKDLEAAMQALRKIAVVNGRGEEAMVKVRQQFGLALKEIEEKEREEAAKHSGPKTDPRLQIFKDWKHLKIMIAVAVFEFGANAYYYGVQFSLGQIGTDFGYNILLTGVIETTAFLTSNLFITKVPRRLGGLSFNIVCVVMGLLFLFDFGMVVQTVLLGACRFFNTYNMAIIPMMQNEPFPHHYRSVAWGYIEGMSQIGNFITPYIVTGCQNAGINPLIIFSFMLALLGTVPLLFYKETQGASEDQLVAIEEQEEKEEHLKNSLQTDQSIDEGLLPKGNNAGL